MPKANRINNNSNVHIDVQTQNVPPQNIPLKNKSFCYTSEHEFREDVMRACKHDVNYQKIINSEDADSSIANAWNIYLTMRDHNKIAVIGKRFVGEVDSTKPGITQKVRLKYRTTSVNVAKYAPEKIGPVLDSSKWSIIMNDAFIVGAIHGKITIRIFSPRDESTLYRDGGLSVFGREMIAVSSCGSYKLFKYIDKDCSKEGARHEKGGTHFTLMDYLKEIERYNTLSKDKVLEKLGIPVEKCTEMPVDCMSPSSPIPIINSSERFDEAYCSKRFDKVYSCFDAPLYGNLNMEAPPEPNSSDEENSDGENSDEESWRTKGFLFNLSGS